MARIALHALLLALYTLLLGVPAILALLVVPRSATLLWFARPWAWLIAATFGTKISSAGSGRIPADRPCVFMSNHQSHFDLIALILAVPGPYRVLAKRSLFWIPVFGWALWLAGFIPVDRSNREKAIESVNRAAEMVRGGRSVLIFAEGTRSPDGQLQPLKKGGFHLALGAEAPIVPVSVSGGRAILPKGELRIRPGEMRVVFGEPVETRGRGEPGMDELMGEVRRALLRGLEPA